MNDQDLLEQLRQSGQFELPSDSSSRVRPVLLAEFDRVTTDPAPRSSNLPSRFYWLNQRPLSAAAVISIIMAVTLGTTSFANAAKPGDLLFGWDQAAERVRLSMTLGDQAKVNYEAQLAEERLQEQQELASQNSDHAIEAAKLSNQALDQAITSVSRVKVKLAGKPGHGSEALSKVESHLRELRTTLNEDSDASSDDVTDDEAGDDRGGIDNGANLNVVTNRRPNRNTNKNANTILDDNDSGSNGNRNNNSSNSGNTPKNISAIRVRVSLNDQTTEMRVVISGVEQEWEIASTDQSVILGSITAKTGLTGAQILASWDFEQR